MSWRPEVLISGHWEHNSVVFATKEEAAANARNLFEHWTMAEDYRATEVDDDINYKMVGPELIAVPEGEKK